MRRITWRYCILTGKMDNQRRKKKEKKKEKRKKEKRKEKRVAHDEKVGEKKDVATQKQQTALKKSKFPNFASPAAVFISRVTRFALIFGCLGIIIQVVSKQVLKFDNQCLQRGMDVHAPHT